MQYHLEPTRILSFNPSPSTSQPGPSSTKPRSRIPSRASSKSAVNSSTSTLPSWPLSPSTHPALTPANLARAGYFYHPDPASESNSSRTDTIDDQCRCFLCGKTLAGWDEADDPFEEHWRRGAASIEAAQASASNGSGTSGKSKKDTGVADVCGWAMAVCSVILDKKKRKAGHKGKGKVPNDWLFTSPILLPSSPEMSAARLSTYGKGNAWWPHPVAKKSGWLTTPASLSKAGFTFTPNADSPDCATCFYCETSLDGWECVDEPWAQHEKRAPDCPFFLACLEGKEAPEVDEIMEEVKPTTTKRATKPLKSAASRKAIVPSTKSAAASRSKKGRSQPESAAEDIVDPSAGETEAETEAEAEAEQEDVIPPAPGPSGSKSRSTADASTKTKAVETDAVDSEGARSRSLIMVSPAKKATRSKKAASGSAVASKGGKSKGRSTASKASSVVESEVEEAQEDTDLDLPEAVLEIAEPPFEEDASPPPVIKAVSPVKRPARGGKKAAQAALEPLAIAPTEPLEHIPPIVAAEPIGLGRPPPQKAPPRITRKASAAPGAPTSTAPSASTDRRMHSRTTSVASVVSASSAATSVSEQQDPTAKAVPAKLKKAATATALPKTGGRTASKTSTVMADQLQPKPAKSMATSAKPVRAPVPRGKKGSSISGAASSSTSSVDSNMEDASAVTESAEVEPSVDIDHTIIQQQEDEIQQIRADSRRMGAREARAVMESLDTFTPRAKQTEWREQDKADPSRASIVLQTETDDMAEMSVLEYIRSVYLQKFNELKEDGERMVGAWEERVTVERRRIETIPSHPGDA